MRIFAVAQLGHAVTVDRQHIREKLVLIGKGKPLADHAVIRSGRRIGFGGHCPAEVIAGRPALFFHFGDQRVIIGRVGDDGYKSMVLCCRPHHRWPADIDILDNFVARRSAHHRLHKRVEVDHHKVDCADPTFFHRSDMFCIVAHGKQTAMHIGVQGLYSPVHHFGKAGQFANILHP